MGGRALEMHSRVGVGADVGVRDQMETLPRVYRIRIRQMRKIQIWGRDLQSFVARFLVTAAFPACRRLAALADLSRRAFFFASSAATRIRPSVYIA